VTSKDKKMESTNDNSAEDSKAKMLAALARKQKGNNAGKASGLSTGSKVGAGQTSPAVPKMHRRKAGSA
jgi:hypothetical protein